MRNERSAISKKGGGTKAPIVDALTRISKEVRTGKLTEAERAHFAKARFAEELDKETNLVLGGKINR